MYFVLTLPCVRLYAGFFKELEPRIKPLSMAQILVEVSTQYKPAEGIAFLENKCRDYKGTNDAYALLKVRTRSGRSVNPFVTLISSHPQTVVAHMYVVDAQPHFDKAKEILAEEQTLLDTAIGVDPVVYSSFYRVLSIFHKSQVHAGEFYKAGLLYLA